MSGGIYSTENANVPSLQSGATALNANNKRLAWSIQNQGTNVLYVCLGSGASSTQYHFTLKGCTVAADGSGGSVSQEAGAVYNGIITIAGTSPSYTVLEMAP